VTYPVDLSPHFGRFILDFVSGPEGLLARVAKTGITRTYTLEIAAWRAELNEQLKRVADVERVQLYLMGGNAASLWLDASAQRSSRDNDYLTTATEAEVDALMGRLAEQFEDLPEPLLRPRRISAESKMKLPLASYLISVPAIIVGNRETLEAKVEFHLENELPPGEDVTGRPFAIGQPLTTSCATRSVACPAPNDPLSRSRCCSYDQAMSGVPADLPPGSAVEFTNPDEDASSEAFRAFIDELLAGPEPELESVDAAEALRALRVDGQA